MNTNLVITIVFATFVVWMLLRSRGDVSREEARRLVDEGALLLDVRSPSEHAAGHIERSMNIPVGELEQRLQALPADKSKAIVVYCRSGARSAAAARLLKQHGYTAVHDLGSISRW